MEKKDLWQTVNKFLLDNDSWYDLVVSMNDLQKKKGIDIYKSNRYLVHTYIWYTIYGDIYNIQIRYLISGGS